MNLLSEIKEDLLDYKIPTSSILRKTYVLARQLGDSNLLEWVQNELNGYYTDKPVNIDTFPSYRRPVGSLQGIGPFNMRKPVTIHGSKLYDTVCRPPIVMSICEVEAHVSNASREDEICMGLPPENVDILCKAIGINLELFLAYSVGTFQGIVEAVRNRLLQLVMDIQEKLPDIEQREPSLIDKKILSKIVVQNIYNPRSCQITANQTTTYSFDEFKNIIIGTLTTQDISREKIRSLRKVLEEAQKESPPKQKTLPKKISNFFKSNKSWLTQTTIELIRKFWLSETG